MSRKAEEAEVARRLQRLGVPLEFDENQCQFVLIRQYESETESSVFELACGAAGYTIHISIVSELPTLNISFLELGLPWSNRGFFWLDGAEDTQDTYRLPGMDLRFEYSACINHYINETLYRGRSIRGLLLGFGFAPIPQEFKHGMVVPAELTLIDQFDYPHRQEIDLRINRSESLVRRKAPRSKREPLFDIHEEIGKESGTVSSAVRGVAAR